MFAVKGWAVDAGSLKPQTELFKSSKAVQQDGDQKPSRKRKREAAAASQQPDVGKLWERHIEGKEPVKRKPENKSEKKNKDKKRQKTADDGVKQARDGPADGQRAKNDATLPPVQAPTDSQKSSKKEKKQQKQKPNGTDATLKDQTQAQSLSPVAPPPVPAGAKLTPMQAAMRQKLVSARFRHLNETLYTAPSKTALGLFDQNPEMFEDYHSGFRQQVAVWPENPVDSFIKTIRKRGAVRPPKFQKNRKPRQDESGGAQVLPRTHGTSIIADLGCGDARLSQTLKESNDVSKLNLKVHSFDLHSPSSLVTKADIANLPLPDGSVDVAIFCLALMGTNWISFIEEAYRILHWKGELWVAEIKSRFGRVGRAGKPVEHSVGSKKKQVALLKAQEVKRKEAEEVDEQTALRTEVDGVETKTQETDVSAFVDVLRRRGFVLKDGDQSIDLGNKMFVRMEFIKAAAPTKGKGVPETVAPEKSTGPRTKKKFIDDKEDDVATEDEAKVLKPCLYKIR